MSLNCRVLLRIALPLSLVLGSVATAHADLWLDVTPETVGDLSGKWTNKVDLADINGDGRVDILFANGSAYNVPNEAEQNTVWLNVGNDEDGVPMFEDVSDEVLGTDGDFTRVIKGRDLNGDGVVDIIVGNTYETQSRLFLGDGDGAFTEATELLPQGPASIGDVEIGDIDGDGDLDLIMADWGLDETEEGLLDPFTAPGGQMLVWRNDLDGAGVFTDITGEAMPDGVLVAWAWEVELIDVDDDFDLDVMASCKSCEGSKLFVNDGQGAFDHVASALPQFTNNYDFEPMFLEVPGRDGTSLTVATINDGEELSNQFDRREHLFVADGLGGFENLTAQLWPDSENVGRDDNMVVVLDVDSDSDPDFLIGALGPEDDRLHVNHLDDDGTFHLDQTDGLSTGLVGTPGTLGIALADLNDDGKLDVVQSQGELADAEHIWLGDEIAADTAAPVVHATRLTGGEDGTLVLRARIHDNKSPSRPHDWSSVTVETLRAGESLGSAEMDWVGEFYWRADGLDGSDESLEFVVCASDAAGNETCAQPLSAGEKADDLDTGGGADDDTSSGCSVVPGSDGLGWTWLGLVGVLLVRRRLAR